MAAQANPERGFIGLRDLVDAGTLAAKRVEVENMRSVLKREWALNREYYNGNQWSFWNASMLRVESLPLDIGPTWKVRLQSNQVKPGLASYVAQLTKTRPTITAEPNSGADGDVKAAQMATSLYESLWEDLHINTRLQEALNEAGLSGGFLSVKWDALAGKPMTFVMDPNGQPILDDELAELFIDKLKQMAQQQGMDGGQVDEMAKKTVYVGEIDVAVMSAENVLIDPSVATFDDAKWAICRHSLDPDEIYARWGKRVQPNATKSADVPRTFASIEEKKPETVREVFIMYIRPCPALPKGRYVAWIEGPDLILEDRDWPYPFQILPLVKLPGIYRPNSPYDDPIVNEARPLQKDLNKTLSQIVEHKNLTLRPQMLAPIGSLRSKITSEPGAIFEYNPVGNQIPQWRPQPEIPQYVFAHLADTQSRIDKVFNRMPTSRDQIPARADGGALLEGMLEATADQLSHTILGIEDALARLGHLMVSYAQKYYDEPRMLRIRGVGGSMQVKKFESRDIEGGFVFRPRYGTGLPRSRQGKQDAIIALVEAKLLDPATAMKHLDMSDLKGVQAQIAADEDQAYREHDKILRGVPINQAALQQAQQQLQQFMQQAQGIAQALQQGQPIDLDGDGQPDDPRQIMQQLQQQQQQLQQALQDAPWQPLDYENWESHISTHAGFMKTSEFEAYDPQLQAIFLQHYNLTYQKWIEIRFAMPDPNSSAKINVRAQTTVSGPVMEKLLRKAGIEATPEEVTSPALDTMVMDNLNAPKVNAGGNDPLTQMDQAITTQQTSDKHTVAQASALQKLGTEQASAAREQAKHDLEMQMLEDQQRQLEEQHQAKLDRLRAQGSGG